MKKMCLFLVSLAVGACNYNHVRSGAAEGTTGNGGLSIQSAGLDYLNVQVNVLGPQCVSCHSQQGGSKGGLNLESFAQVRAAMNSIYFRSIEKRDMPPREALSSSQMDLLKSWLEAGAPEKNMGRGSGREIKGPITWTVIKEQVFKSSCLDCHSGATPDGGLDLESFEVTKKNIDKIFKSAITEGSMPLQPYPSMSAFEKQALMKWISQGMPE